MRLISLRAEFQAQNSSSSGLLGGRPAWVEMHTKGIEGVVSCHAGAVGGKAARKCDRFSRSA